jgi:hypothetical protein
MEINPDNSSHRRVTLRVSKEPDYGFPSVPSGHVKDAPALFNLARIRPPIPEL